MPQESSKHVWKRFTSYVADLSPANKCIAILMIVSVFLEILIFLGFMQDTNNKTLAIMSFALLALLAVVLDMQVQQKRALDENEKFHRQTENSLSSNKASLNDILELSAPFDVRPEFIKPELDGLLDPKSVRFWKFRGGSGRWQRSTVLPTLARVPTTDVEYKMLILDPRSVTLCNQYAKYRNTHRLRPGNASDVGQLNANPDTAKSVANKLWHASWPQHGLPQNLE